MPISCSTEVFETNGWLIARLPEAASKQLPSRGQVYVRGTINGVEFQAALEPDGHWSHWLNIDKKLQKSTGLKPGDAAELTIEPSKDWPEPDIPTDIAKALASATDVQELWQKITPMSRWEWIRWIGATVNTETRSRRIETALSKMRKGERRPCCFNRNMCCVPAVSKSGVLLMPAHIVES